jgi:glycosyltransferase involved in cell wall biosynthesis
MVVTVNFQSHLLSLQASSTLSRNGDTGLWIDRIELLAEDERLRKWMGREGRRWVSSTFSWDKIAAQVESILKRISPSRR